LKKLFFTTHLSNFFHKMSASDEKATITESHQEAHDAKEENSENAVENKEKISPNSEIVSPTAETKQEEYAETPSKTLFVSNISWRVRKKELMVPFAKFGRISDCKIVQYFDQTEKRVKSKGYAFIKFATEEEANKARVGLNGEKLVERELVVKFSTSTGPKGRRSSKKIAALEAQEEKGEVPDEFKTPEKEDTVSGRITKANMIVSPTDDGKNEKHSETQNNYRTLFLKTLPTEVTKKQINDLFKSFGPTQTVKIIKRRSRRNSPKTLQAMAFCTFETHDLAKKIFESSMEEGKGLKMGEKDLELQISIKQPGDFPPKPQEEAFDTKADTQSQGTSSSAVGKPPAKQTPGRRRIYVSRLSETTTETTLTEKFSTFGNVRKCSIRQGKNPENPVKFAYIKYEKATEAAAAIEKGNNTVFEGAKLNVEFAKVRRLLTTKPVAQNSAKETNT